MLVQNLVWNACPISEILLLLYIEVECLISEKWQFVYVIYVWRYFTLEPVYRGVNHRCAFRRAIYTIHAFFNHSRCYLYALGVFFILGKISVYRLHCCWLIKRRVHLHRHFTPGSRSEDFPFQEQLDYALSTSIMSSPFPCSYGQVFPAAADRPVREKCPLHDRSRALKNISCEPKQWIT